MPHSALSGVLADTWWYGLSKRCSAKDFEALAELRVSQGFNAIQLVVGIPPETGPQNHSNWSDVGPAWDISGNINQDYLSLAAERVQLLNSLGLKVIIYGAWGYQIEWLGITKMAQWWHAIHDVLGKFDVEYCLTGELDLWLQEPERLLPDKTTDDLLTTPKPTPSWLTRKYSWYITRHTQRRRRISQWKKVASNLPEQMQDSLIVHPTLASSGKTLLGNAVSIETIMTGHDGKNRNALWQRPIQALKKYQSVLNLEPWYEGINDSFGTADQLYAYWCSMLSGCEGYCYGAQGIWNMGDGEFLSHWGKQSFDQAKLLVSPQRIGESHKLLAEQLGNETLLTPTIKLDGETLLSISNNSESTHFEFIPEISQTKPTYSGGLIWLPEKTSFSIEPPASGSAVLINQLDQALQ